MHEALFLLYNHVKNNYSTSYGCRVVFNNEPIIRAIIITVL